jgi:uncharacterized protein (TIGR02611 family)
MALASAMRVVVRGTKRVVVTVVGFGLLAVGLAGLVLPILPGWLLIFAALAVLATEYGWARRAMEAVRLRAANARRWSRQAGTALAKDTALAKERRLP